MKPLNSYWHYFLVILVYLILFELTACAQRQTENLSWPEQINAAKRKVAEVNRSAKLVEVLASSEQGTSDENNALVRFIFIDDTNKVIEVASRRVASSDVLEISDSTGYMNAVSSDEVNFFNANLKIVATSPENALKTAFGVYSTIPELQGKDLSPRASLEISRRVFEKYGVAAAWVVIVVKSGGTPPEDSIQVWINAQDGSLIDVTNKPLYAPTGGGSIPDDPSF